VRGPSSEGWEVAPRVVPAPLECARTVQFAPCHRAAQLPDIQTGSTPPWCVCIFSGQGAMTSSHDHLALAAILRLSLMETTPGRWSSVEQKSFCSQRNSFLHAGTTWPTPPHSSHWWRARQTAKCCWNPLHHFLLLPTTPHILLSIPDNLRADFLAHIFAVIHPKSVLSLFADFAEQLTFFAF